MYICTFIIEKKGGGDDSMWVVGGGWKLLAHFNVMEKINGWRHLSKVDLYFEARFHGH